MDITSLIATALSSTAFISFLIWFFQNPIAKWFERKVQHGFDTKLEGLKAQMRASEERLKADLRVKEAEIVALRGGALSALASRQIAIDKRRLEAVDQLWSSIIELGKLRRFSQLLSVIKFDVLAEQSEKNPKVREVASTVLGDLDIGKLTLGEAEKARPFVSPMVWAVYSAIQAVTLDAVTKWHFVKHGIAAKKLLDEKYVTNMIKAALPYMSSYLDEHGSAGFHYTLESLDALLLIEVQKMLSGAETDQAGIDQAATILELAGKARVSMEDTPPLTPETAAYSAA